MDQELAAHQQSVGCPRCGGVLHSAIYPRKPRACPLELRADYASRLSFCCARCRRRSTPPSVRFLGRRVYLALTVVLAATPRAQTGPAGAEVAAHLNIPRRTLKRWRDWWCQAFPLTSLWQAASARFMPPVAMSELPTSLLARFTGSVAGESLMRLLVFLKPLSVTGGSR